MIKPKLDKPTKEIKWRTSVKSDINWIKVEINNAHTETWYWHYVCNGHVCIVFINEWGWKKYGIYVVLALMWELTIYSFLFPGKPRGIRTARKLKDHRRDQRWADKDYKKAHLGTRWKSNPFGGASHAKGIVLEKV